MSDMKCPICNDGKIIAYPDGTYECDNPECSIYNGTHTETFEALIRTRKELEQSEICCTEWEKQALDYKAENIALSGNLERTRKALDVALDWLEQVATPEKCDDDLCREFTKRKLTEIKTALEQKDK